MIEKSYSESLRLAALLTKPAILQAIDTLDLPRESYGLDAGCGIGTHAHWLAKATDGRVTGVDCSLDNLSTARHTIQSSPLQEKIEFIQGDLTKLAFPDQTFDWVWCSDTLWPVVIPNPITVVCELKRVVKPNGMVAIVFWSGQQFLPGHPRLEARLNQAFIHHTHYYQITRPGHHHMRALGWLRAANLQQTRARSFVAQTQAPLSDEMKESVRFCIGMFWDNLKSNVSPDDWDQYQRLSDPDSKDFILKNPDYYCLVTYTLFYGKAA